MNSIYKTCSDLYNKISKNLKYQSVKTSQELKDHLVTVLDNENLSNNSRVVAKAMKDFLTHSDTKEPDIKLIYEKLSAKPLNLHSNEPIGILSNIASCVMSLYHRQFLSTAKTDVKNLTLEMSDMIYKKNKLNEITTIINACKETFHELNLENTNNIKKPIKNHEDQYPFKHEFKKTNKIDEMITTMHELINAIQEDINNAYDINENTQDVSKKIFKKNIINKIIEKIPTDEIKKNLLQRLNEDVKQKPKTQIQIENYNIHNTKEEELLYIVEKYNYSKNYSIEEFVKAGKELIKISKNSLDNEYVGKGNEVLRQSSVFSSCLLDRIKKNLTKASHKPSIIAKQFYSEAMEDMKILLGQSPETLEKIDRKNLNEALIGLISTLKDEDKSIFLNDYPNVIEYCDIKILFTTTTLQQLNNILDKVNVGPPPNIGYHNSLQIAKNLESLENTPTLTCIEKKLLEGIINKLTPIIELTGVETSLGKLHKILQAELTARP